MEIEPGAERYRLQDNDGAGVGAFVGGGVDVDVVGAFVGGGVDVVVVRAVVDVVVEGVLVDDVVETGDECRCDFGGAGDDPRLRLFACALPAIACPGKAAITTSATMNHAC